MKWTAAHLAILANKSLSSRKAAKAIGCSHVTVVEQRKARGLAGYPLPHDEIWRAVYGAFIVAQVVEEHERTSRYPDLADYDRFRDEAATVADNDAEARQRELVVRGGA